MKSLFLSIMIIILVSCDTNNPPISDPDDKDNDKSQPKITLTFVDNSCTEIWLKVDVENIQLPDTFLLRRNGVAVDWFEITESEMEIYQDSLRPSQSYTYTAIINDTVTGEVTAITMDTTSHNFTWEVFEFGEHGNSILRDVAIIDENNIWAVGAIYLKDSTGANDSKAYNAVHWDGNEWKHKRIQFYTFCNQPSTSSYPARSILAFSQNQILISSGSQVTSYDGENQLNIECIPVSVNKMWGTDINNVYAAGAIGNIAHYNGTSWRKIESGTEITLTDVYGENSNEVYIGGVEVFESGIVLKGNSSGFSVYKNAGYVSESELFETLYAELGTVWIDEKGTLYTGGSYLYWERRGEWNFVESLPENYYQANIGAPSRGYIVGITGNGSNDYVISGGRNETERTH